MYLITSCSLGIFGKIWLPDDGFVSMSYTSLIGRRDDVIAWMQSETAALLLDSVDLMCSWFEFLILF